MTLEQIVKQSQGEQYVYPDVFTDKCGLDIILSNDKLHAVRSWGYPKVIPKGALRLKLRRSEAFLSTLYIITER